MHPGEDTHRLIAPGKSFSGVPFASGCRGFLRLATFREVGDPTRQSLNVLFGLIESIQYILLVKSHFEERIKEFIVGETFLFGRGISANGEGQLYQVKRVDDVLPTPKDGGVQLATLEPPLHRPLGDTGTLGHLSGRQGFSILFHAPSNERRVATGTARRRKG